MVGREECRLEAEEDGPDLADVPLGQALESAPLGVQSPTPDTPLLPICP